MAEVDPTRMHNNQLLLAPRDLVAEQRARLVVAGYARCEHPRAPRKRRDLCTELLDELGLLPQITDEDRAAIAEDVRYERTADAATPYDEEATDDQS